ncbi:hypothetical protein [Cohnella sp. REN36]|nr:hypothetical protein [Cohnella sp. REN36]
MIAEFMPDSEEEIAAQLMNLSIRGPYWRNPIEHGPEACPR